MIGSNRLPILLFCMVCCLGPYAIASDNNMSEAKNIKNGNLSLRVSLSTTRRAGESIWCEVGLINGGQADVSYHHISEWRLFLIAIALNGQDVPLTQFGKIELSNNEGNAKRSVLKKVRPGEQLVRRYNLARLFDLSLEGKYELSVAKELEENKKKIVVKAEKIELMVEEPPAERMETETDVPPRRPETPPK